VIEDRAQGSVFEKTLKEFELIESSRGIAPLFQWHRTKVANRGFSRGRESTTGVRSWRITNSTWIMGSRERSCEEINPQVPEEPICHGTLANRGWRVQESQARKKIAKCDSPIWSRSLIRMETGGTNPKPRSFGIRGFQQQEPWSLVNPQTANSRRDVAAWDPGESGGPVGPYQESAIRYSGI
jgi:hypothetical protein